ncbi:MAG: nucleotidyl transferase AbiEii/AbiGii toxin family protein [Nitrospinae bacterium]|nr:nucleotidyl transferase AbiEii/AbiGii toxin family protein [Nitrospinota bacterium]
MFEAVARRLGTSPSYVEKDFWVCFVLDVLYNGLPGGHPKLLFKGGTSLSKAFGLIERFSEDTDLVIYRDGLGFEGDRDPTIARDLSSKRRSALFRELTVACSDYILGDFKAALTRSIDAKVEGCRILPDEDDDSRQMLFIEYPTLYPSGDVSYVSPRVKIEAGARSALDPNLICTVNPYISDELPDWSFDVDGIRTLVAERTYWEKLLILKSATIPGVCSTWTEFQYRLSNY